MIAIDTNVLVRHIVRDHEPQYARAAAMIHGAVGRGERVLVTEGVVLELVWVLCRSYRLPRAAVIATLRELIDGDEFVFDARRLIEGALIAWEHGHGDFAEYLFREQALAAGATSLATFDEAVRGEPGFLTP